MHGNSNNLLGLICSSLTVGCGLRCRPNYGILRIFSTKVAVAILLILQICLGFTSIVITYIMIEEVREALSRIALKFFAA